MHSLSSPQYWVSCEFETISISHRVSGDFIRKYVDVVVQQIGIAFDTLIPQMDT
jgi:hypothetical protein